MSSLDQPMTERPPPPEHLKPWYYRNAYLFPAILPIFWPLWPVLIIRSPWHNGIASGGVAWAMLIVGSYVMVQRLLAGALDFIAMFVLPGLILSVATQIHWIRYKEEVLDRQQPPAAMRQSGQSPEESSPASPRRGWSRRRGRRRGSARPGRSSRHPY